MYIFGILQNRFSIKHIYDYTKTFLSEWFPHLPSYSAFDNRICRLNNIFPILTERILSENFPYADINKTILIDSMPIFVANEKRCGKAKAASEISDVGYCSSKSLYYYGVKIHIAAMRQVGHLPVPVCFIFSNASENDITAFRRISNNFCSLNIFGDKAYQDKTDKQLFRQQDTEIFTPVKKKKGAKKLNYFEQLYSTGVSRVRQPVESLFSWIQEKTKIQFASKVRSKNGLLSHVFGKICAAFFLFFLNS